jgi:GT2 family glycosyltransferase
MIYIIIPVFNRKALTRECLCSIEEQGYKNFKIVVVDHGSTDGTSEMIMKHFSEVIILKGDESMWWTAATNIGIKKALSLSSSDHDFILTLNNDLIVDIDYLNQLLKVYEINKPCIVGSVSVDIKNPNKISYIGLKWNKITAKYKPNSCINIIYKNVVNCFDFIESDT